MYPLSVTIQGENDLKDKSTDNKTDKVLDANENIKIKFSI